MLEGIRETYEERKMESISLKYSSFPVYRNHVIRERQKIYNQVVKSRKVSVGDLKFLEIGAGLGHNLPYFKSLGIGWDNMYLNELLDDRIEVLRNRYPAKNIYPGDALELPFENKFDIVFQSTVFTSIPSESFRVSLAQRLWEMTKEDGVILWYDFIYNNPNNPNVRKVTRQDVLKFFPDARAIDFHSVTLAPPIGRRIGNSYRWVNALFPFLRSHLIAVIHK